mgnify:CR=1 FL=1
MRNVIIILSKLEIIATKKYITPIFAILTMWGIRIGLTWIYIGMFGRDLKMVWFFMIMDNISRCILLWSLYRRRKRSLLLFDEY